MIKWEYDFVIDPDKAFLNYAGKDGWELVIIVSSPGHDVYHFKRPTNFMEIQNELREAWVEAIKSVFAELFNESDL